MYIQNLTHFTVNKNVLPLKKNEYVTDNLRNNNQFNLNNINYTNYNLIKFTGYTPAFEQTIKDNYFNLSIDKETGKPFKPDIYQKAAAENLYNGNDVVVAAPTGTGKTAIAHYIIQKNLNEGKKTFYTAPLKALSNDKVREFEKIYGKENVGLLTGDRKINTNAPIVIMTTEVYRNMLMQDKMNNSNPMLNDLHTVVFDELHYLNDEDRGGVWEQSILFTKPKTQILALSGTMANAGMVTDWVSSTKDRGVAEKITPDENYKVLDLHKPHTVLINVPTENRHVPLKFEVLRLSDSQQKNDFRKKGLQKSRIKLQKSKEKLTPSTDDYLTVVNKLRKEDKLPAIFFVFSKKKSKELLNEMCIDGPTLTTKEEEQSILNEVEAYKQRGKYIGSMNIEALCNGYAIHNAGMLPDQKELVENLFRKKLLKVAIATETLSAGINMPARTTIISTVTKPVSRTVDESGRRVLMPNEFHQMAGRAGRRGIDAVGHTICMACNGSQEKIYQNLINEKSNDINSHLKTDYSFVININKNFKDKGFLKEFFHKSLYAYDNDKDIRNKKANDLFDNFHKKENILKSNGYITKDNQITEKGELLSYLNGYEQIPVIDAIYNKDMANMTPQQLAGYVAGLATLACDKQNNDSDMMVDYGDCYLEERTRNLQSRVFEYNADIYSKDNLELKLNTNAVNHVYQWADRNSKNSDSIENWRSMFSKQSGFDIKDEGTLFREIVITQDLLKQISEISGHAKNSVNNLSDRKYYTDLHKTADIAVNLINKTPARQDDEF